MDYRLIAYDVCQRYVRDQKGLIGDEVANLVLGWIRARDLTRLCNASDLIPGAYSHRELCRFSRQVAAFFKKNAAFSDPQICLPAAQHSFERAERLCRITNKRLDYYWFHRDRLNPALDGDLRRAERILADVLGDTAEFVEALPRLIRVTSGASATRSRAHSLPYRKVRFRGLPATPRAVPYLTALSRHFGYPEPSFKICLENRVETVPKNWKTDRTIACEPEGNLSLQLAVDAYVKSKLKRKLGLDLSDQSENQRLAGLGSKTGSLATIDLSMASDTVSLNSVAWLFPRKWYTLLCDLRCPKGHGFGQSYEYAKLSSMGNGATFAIETLIFATLCKAVRPRTFRVYGDDIIIDADKVDRLTALLSFLGYVVNTEKSYREGPFRESCGSDWYDGVDVTPFYIRSGGSMKVELCHLVNGLASLTYPGGALEQLLLTIVKEERLPLIPWNWSSISGVWIYPHDAYSLGLIQNKDPKTKGLWTPSVRAFTPVTRKRPVRDSRTLFLWHLHAQERGIGGPVYRTRHLSSLYSHADCGDAPSSSIISSSVPIFTHKYVREWVCWQPPAEVTPAHLYGWTDSLIRSNTG